MRPSRDRLIISVCGMTFLSGAAALALETVWIRMLTRAVGVTVYAVSSVVAVFLGGLALGAWAASRLPRPRDDLKAYAGLEAAAALAALVCAEAMRRLPEALAAWGEGPLSVGVRALVCVPVLLPPTLLWGATLPILARVFCRTGGPSSGAALQSGVGKLYAANTFGGAFGVAAAGFWTIGEWGETATVWCAAAAGALAAVWALGMGPSSSPTPSADRGVATAGDPAVLRLYALSGFCALACEVIWTRQLGFMLGNSTYAFSLVLVLILMGIALGSLAAPGLSEDGLAPLVSFGLLQLGLAAAAALSLAAFHTMGLAADSPAYLYAPLGSPADLVRMALQAGVMVLPSSFIMGLMFPAAARAYSPNGGDAAGPVGALYAANTLGGIAGSLAVLAGVRAVGTHRAMLCLVGIAALAGLASAAISRVRGLRVPPVCGAVAALILGLAVFARRDPVLEMLTRRWAKEFGAAPQVLFHEESAAAVATGVAAGPVRTLLLNGIKTAGNTIDGTFMAVLPHALLARPASTLVVCFGAGNTFRTASILGGEVHAVDLVPQTFGRMKDFYPDAAQHLTRPGRAVFIEDGRHYLLRVRRRYSSIIVDATPPLHSSGAVNLYSREFMALARRRLEGDGILTLWLPYLSLEDDYWAILKGMTDTFEHVGVWAWPGFAGLLCLGSRAPFEWPAGELERRIAGRRIASVVRPFGEREIRAGLLMPESELRRRLEGRRALSDDRPWTEFHLRRLWNGRRPVRGPDFLRAAR